jgi:glycosyltransferase involved in cell wall biosynthesis
MPVRNAGETLSWALSSVLSQRFTDWELVAVEDHSRDNSLRILEKYERIEERMRIVPSRGRRVATLFSGDTGPGEREVTWNGRNGSGEPAASGVYFLRLKGDTSSHTIKMLLLK